VVVNSVLTAAAPFPTTPTNPPSNGLTITADSSDDLINSLVQELSGVASNSGVELTVSRGVITTSAVLSSLDAPRINNLGEAYETFSLSDPLPVLNLSTTLMLADSGIAFAGVNQAAASATATAAANPLVSLRLLVNTPAVGSTAPLQVSPDGYQGRSASDALVEASAYLNPTLFKNSVQESAVGNTNLNRIPIVFATAAASTVTLAAATVEITSNLALAIANNGYVFPKEYVITADLSATFAQGGTEVSASSALPIADFVASRIDFIKVGGGFSVSVKEAEQLSAAGIKIIDGSRPGSSSTVDRDLTVMTLAVTH
jgi:hypothetical protein